MLITIDSVLNDAQLQAIHQQLQSVPNHWHDGGLTAGPVANAIKNNHQLASDSPVLQSIGTTVLQALQQHPVFFSAALPLNSFPPRINRHGVGEYYGNHYDNAVLGQPGNYVRSDVSCTVFLSDPSQYTGGELCIQDTFGTHRIKLAAGSAVIYPSSSLHQVAPVTEGERIGCFFWMQSMVRSSEQRRLLYDLDMAITELRSQHGSDSNITQLTGTYHNLLRMWSEL